MYYFYENRYDKLLPQPTKQKSTQTKKRRLNQLGESWAEAKWLTTTRRLEALQALGEAILLKNQVAAEEAEAKRVDKEAKAREIAKKKKYESGVFSLLLLKKFIPTNKDQMTLKRLRDLFKKNKQQLLAVTEVSKLPSVSKRSDLVDFLIEHNVCENAAVFVSNDA